MTYDNMGNLLASISGKGDEQSVVQYAYDTANRMTKMITGLSAYSANPTGGSVTQYTYNSKGFLYQVTDPMGHAENYTDYDKYGNIGMKEDRNGNIHDYTYGAYGVTCLNSWIGTNNITTYNSIGQVVKTSAQNENGEIVEESYTYDPFGRVISKTSNDGTVQNYTYDNNSNLVAYTMTQDGETKNSIEYTYNNLNRLTKFDSGDMIYTYGYDKNGNLQKVLDGKQAVFNYDIVYNKANLPVNIDMDYYSKSYNYTMSYWANGQKYLEQDTVNNVWTEYDYNSLGQLEFEQRMVDNKTVSELDYTYDKSGNRTRMRSFNPDTHKWDVITDYTYDANNRLTDAITKQNNDITSATRYYYDDNGNTLAEQNKVYTAEGEESSNMGLSGRVGGGSTKVYTYDRFNRLIRYNDGANEAIYTYGVDNLRASKKVNGVKTDFVWNGQNLAGETTNDITTIYNYDRTGVLGSKKDGEAVVRYHKDPHGNVLAMEKNNALAGEYTYDAFGNQLTTAEIDNPFRYCGEYYDNESGNVYLRNRYYDTSTGRFINEDPIKDGLNWYSYCAGEPVMHFDPSGLEEVLLKYIAEKKNGTVSWDNKSKVATVSFPGYAPIKAKGRIVNGRTIVDSQWLIDNFGLDEYEATHHEDEWFESPEDAVLAFGLKYYEKAVNEQQEYGAAINVKYLRSGDRFWFKNVTSSAQSAGKLLSELTDEERRRVIIPRDYNSYADVHIHWRKNGNKNFSDTDPGVSFKNPQIKVTYLINQEKEVKRLDRSEYENYGYIHGNTIFGFNYD